MADRRNDVRPDQNYQDNLERGGLRGGFRKAIYHMDDPRGNHLAGNPDVVTVDDPERRIRINVRRDWSLGIYGNSNYWDMRYEPLERTRWQKFVNAAKWPSKGGDRPQRADKRLDQFNKIQSDILTKLDDRGLPSYPLGTNNLFISYVQKVKELGQQFGQQYNDATADWGQDTSWDKVQRVFGTGEAEGHHRKRMVAYPRLKLLNQELGYLNVDLESMQQIQDFRKERIKDGRWTNNVNSNEYLFNYALKEYSNFLSNTSEEAHKNNFEKACATILKQSLDEPNLEYEQISGFWNFRHNANIKEVNKQRKQFNDSMGTIKSYIQSDKSFTDLEDSQQNGIIKRLISLTREFKTNSANVLTAGMGSERKAHKKRLNELNKELGMVNDLLDKLAVVNDTNKFNVLWNSISPEDQKSKFKGYPGKLQSKLQKRVDKAIPAYIEKYDSSFLAGRDELANRKALRNFEKYSKWLANLTTPVDEYVNQGRRDTRR